MNSTHEEAEALCQEILSLLTSSSAGRAYGNTMAGAGIKLAVATARFAEAMPRFAPLLRSARIARLKELKQQIERFLADCSPYPQHPPQVGSSGKDQ